MFTFLATEARQIIESLYGLKDIDPAWETPKERTHGDIATSVALRISKTVGKNPREIGIALAKKLADSPSVLAVDVAGPGYVNVFLRPAVLLQELELVSVHLKPAAVTDVAPVIVEYSQPNIAKPLGIHHILSTVIGQSIANIYRHGGKSVIAWNYIGDWGTQFGKLAVAFNRWGNKSAADCSLDELLELYVRFHKEAEQDVTLEEEGRAAFRKLESGDETIRAFWSDVVSVTKKSLNDIYDRLHVHFDVDVGESYYEEAMQPIIEEGKKKGVFKEGEGGALIAEFPTEQNMPPAIIVKGDGATIYLTRDLATLRDRIDRFKPKSINYIVDTAQSLHFKQLFAIAHQLEWNIPELTHVSMGRMRFADKSMSTRKGNILKLEHVLDEAVERAAEIIAERGDAIQTDNPEDLAEMMGVGAVAYGILSQNRKMDMVFSWEKMLSFEGNSAPYIQYTHARARSVLRKAQMEEGEIAVSDITEMTEADRELLLTLLQFPSVLREASEEQLPHKLATFLYILCQSFNSLYNAEQIMQAEEPLRSLRLHLTKLTADSIRAGATLLTIRVPDRM